MYDEKIDKERNILRRERFQFDEIYAGVGAHHKLYAVIRDRVKRNLSLRRNFAFVVLSCGESIDDSLLSPVEPSLALLFGDRGGSGLLSTVVNELFSLLRPPSKSLSISSDIVNFQCMQLALSAVVLYKHGEVLDLLCDATTTTNKTCKLLKRNNGKLFFTNLTTIKLDKSSDLDRIVGVLLGKKACRHELVSFLSKHGENVSQIDESFSSSSTTSHLLDSSEATLFVSVKVVSSMNTGKQTPTAFHFVCPYGSKWATPSEDICLFTEILACYPHTPPSSIQQTSIISHLLLDPFIPTDFMCVANITKSYKEINQNASKTPSPFCSAISSNSFRHITHIVKESSSSKLSSDDIQTNLVQKALCVLRLISHLPQSHL